MDTLAHGFWSFAIFHKKKYVWLAVLFGILPDLLSFGILLLTRALSGAQFERGPPSVDGLPSWLFISYNMMHSFVVFVIVFLAVYLLTKKWLWYMVAWPIHIFIDIPTHSTRFFPTPFLWPISNYSFDGISWATPWFMWMDYLSLIVIFVVISVMTRNKATR